VVIDRALGGAAGSRRSRWLLEALIAGAAAGGVLAAAGQPGAAHWVWGGTTIAGSLPVTADLARSVLRRRPGVDLLALIAMLGCLGLGELLAGAVIAVMLASGRALEAYAESRAQRELTALLQRNPQVAHRVTPTGTVDVAVTELLAGERLLIKPSEVVPVDGRVTGNSALVDESALTGEARPVLREAGDQVRSGVVNAGGPFRLLSSVTAEQSTYAGILRLVRSAAGSRAPFVRLADRYALAFVPFALLIAAIAWGMSGNPVRALAVIVVATPCPLILAAPVAIVAGMSRAARHGVVIKDGGALEALARARVLIFDKTGTLTAGHATVAGIKVEPGWSPDQLLGLAASLDQASTHPLAAALVRAARRRGLDLTPPSGTDEVPGSGISGQVNGRKVRLGRLQWVAGPGPPPEWSLRLRRRASSEGRSAVFVGVDNGIAGAIVLDDPIRADSARTIRSLRAAGIQRVVMASGDQRVVADTVGAALGVDEVIAECTPARKVDAVLAERVRGMVIMVGDGINDAPALAAADVGVAMGARGSTATSETADVVLVVDRLERLVYALHASQRSRRVALESVLAGMGLSILAMAAAAAGLLPPLAGAILQEAIDVAVILNALRAHAGGRGQSAVSPAALALSRELQRDHDALLSGVDELRSLADRLDHLPPPDAMTQLYAVHAFLASEILPHETREERSFYPLVAARIGGDDPVATMVREHVEIGRLTRLLGHAIDDVGEAGPGGHDLPELRRLLYGLHTVLRLHFAQEDEAYLSLMDQEEADRHETNHAGRTSLSKIGPPALPIR
jgi:heavy metal translocating P-type ATPase